MADSLADYLALMEYNNSKQNRNAQRGLQSQFYDLFSGMENNGTADPAFSRFMTPLLDQAKAGTGGQFDLAKKNIMSTLPVGGMQQDALAKLEGTRAKTESELPSFLSRKMTEDLLGKSYSAAFGPDQNQDVLHNMIRTAQSVDQAQQAQEEAGDNQLWGSIGALLAAVVGMYTGGAGYGALMGLLGGAKR